MIGLKITVRDNARPAVNAFIQGMKPGPLAQIAGRSARNVIRTHLFAYNGDHGNRLGGSRTNYYTGAARATQFRVEGDVAIVSINQVGIALRYYGGTVKPVTKKFLTIPARSETHGKRASEFADLIVLFNAHGPYALARAVSTSIGIARERKASIKDLKNRLADNAVGARHFKQSRIENRGQQGGEIMFWLVKSANVPADKNVLPSNEELSSQVNRDVLDYAFRLWARKNPSTAGGES